jgi:hypothetical protein
VAARHLPDDARKPVFKQSRETRRRAARARRKREQKIRSDRREAVSDPSDAHIKPAGVTVVEFRKLTGLSHATVHRWIKARSLKSVKINGRRLIAYSEVERLRGE